MQVKIETGSVVWYRETQDSGMGVRVEFRYDEPERDEAHEWRKGIWRETYPWEKKSLVLKPVYAKKEKPTRARELDSSLVHVSDGGILRPDTAVWMEIPPKPGEQPGQVYPTTIVGLVKPCATLGTWGSPSYVVKTDPRDYGQPWDRDLFREVPSEFLWIESDRSPGLLNWEEQTAMCHATGWMGWIPFRYRWDARVGAVVAPVFLYNNSPPARALQTPSSCAGDPPWGVSGIVVQVDDDGTVYVAYPTKADQDGKPQELTVLPYPRAYHQMLFVHMKEENDE